MTFSFDFDKNSLYFIAAIAIIIGINVYSMGEHRKDCNMKCGGMFLFIAGWILLTLCCCNLQKSLMSVKSTMALIGVSAIIVGELEMSRKHESQKNGTEPVRLESPYSLCEILYYLGWLALAWALGCGSSGGKLVAVLIAIGVTLSGNYFSKKHGNRNEMIGKVLYAVGILGIAGVAVYDFGGSNSWDFELD